MADSRKIDVVRILFKKAWPKNTREPKHPVIVTNDDVGKAIRKSNSTNQTTSKQLSSQNPANFLKDIVRTYTCNENWPKELTKRRITARQLYGKKQVLEFVRFRKKEDKVPFPDRYDSTHGIRVIEIESLTIPRQARALGRQDEAWLTQVIVNQRIAQTHFSVVSSHSVIELTHLQMSVKKTPEIDAIFIATLDLNGREVRALVTCEAKQGGERLLEDQIRQQVGVAFKMTALLGGVDKVEAVIPTAMRVMTYKGVRGIHMVEFGVIMRKNFDTKYAGAKLHDMPLKLNSKAFYVLKPDVQGISTPVGKPAKPKVTK